MDQESRRISLKWKIGGTYTAVMLVLSVFVIAAMYQLTNKMLRDQLDKRALAVAVNLSDASRGSPGRKKSARAPCLVEKVFAA